MAEEKIMLGPFVYAALKAMKAYREAEDAYKNTAVEAVGENSFLKIFSSLAGELEKSLDEPAADFLKKYQRYESLFSILLKLLG